MTFTTRWRNSIIIRWRGLILCSNWDSEHPISKCENPIFPHPTNPHINGPLQFKAVLYKGQLYIWSLRPLIWCTPLDNTRSSVNLWCQWCSDLEDQSQIVTYLTNKLNDVSKTVNVLKKKKRCSKISSEVLHVLYQLIWGHTAS